MILYVQYAPFFPNKPEIIPPIMGRAVPLSLCFKLPARTPAFGTNAAFLPAPIGLLGALKPSQHDANKTAAALVQILNTFIF